MSVLTEQQDIEFDVNAGSGITNTELSDVSSPQMPTDCLAPHMLWERATANTGDVFAPMEKFTRGGSMLNLQASSYLRFWEWREDNLNLIGATQAITGAHSLREGASGAYGGNRPGADSVGDRSAGVCHRGAGEDRGRWRRICWLRRRWRRKTSLNAMCGRSRRRGGGGCLTVIGGG